MLSRKDIAEVYRLGLTIGMFSVDQVVEWADSIIAVEDNPEFALIEVSTNGDATEGKMATLLRDVQGEVDARTARNVIYGLLGRKLAADRDAADTVAAQAKAVQQGEGVHGEVGDDLAADLGRHEALAAAWDSHKG
jgi:hypothetical protein